MHCPTCDHDNPEGARFCNACSAPLAAVPPPTAPQPPTSYTVTPSGAGATAAPGEVFVGRQRELNEMRAALQSALLGQGQVVLLAGEPGIGKTRLAAELASEAQKRGAQVLTGQTYEWEGTPAYWPWVQIVRAYLREGDPGRLRDDLGQGAATIAQIVPEIADVLPGLPALPRLEPEQARFQLFDAFATFLKRVAERRPVMLVLDDLHWADRSSLLLLEFVARETGRTRLLVVGTYRDVEVGRKHPLAQTLAELNRSRLSRRILLRGLAREDVDRFISQSVGGEPPSDVVDAVYRETEGNPFFVIEVVRLLSAEGRLARPLDNRAWSVSLPESVREVVGLRLGRLSASCNQVLAVASVVGREFRLATLERVTGRPGDELLDVLEEAVQARLLEEQDALGHFRFSHALVQETLYAELSTARRVRLHGQIGDAIERLQAAQLPHFYGELAHHYFEAAPGGAVDKALDYLTRAGDAALADLGYDEAIGYVERALQLLDLQHVRDDERRCELLLRLADAQARSGNWPVADATYRLAARSAFELQRFDLLATAALGSEESSLLAPFDREWSLLFGSAVEHLGRGDSLTHARLLARLAVALDYAQDERDRQRTLSDDAVAMARRLNDPSTLAFTLLAKYVTQTLPFEQRLDVLDEAIDLTKRVEDWQLALWGHVLRFTTMLQAGYIDEAAREQQAFAALAERLRQPADIRIAARLHSTLALVRGDLAEHARWASEAEERALHEGWDIELLRIYRLYVEQDRVGDLEEPIARAAAAPLEQFVRPPVFRFLLLLVHAYQQRTDDARRELDALAADRFRALGHGMWRVLNIALVSEAVWLLGDATHAAWLYDQLLPLGDEGIGATGANSWNGSAALHVGRLATLLERWDDAEWHYTDALAMHERMGARPYAAQTRHSWALMLARRVAPGDLERALALNAQALAAAEEMGMTWLARETLALKKRLQGMLQPSSERPAGRMRDARTGPELLRRGEGTSDAGN